MGFEAKLPTILSIVAIILFCGASSATPINAPQFQTSLESFSKNMFSEIYQSNGQKNIIFSPFSIQTCLAMVRMAAGGQTAIEMDQGLSFTGQSAESVADKYHTMLAKYENSKILKIANKVYVKQGYELQDNYNQVLSQKFFSSAENVDFSQSTAAANTINSWVASKTNNAIKDLVEPDTFSSDTRLFLLSAIHFKGNWKKPFDVKDTTEQDFYTDETNTVKVQMMSKRGHHGYGRFFDLEAQAIVLPYQDSDLSMMIILPDSLSGLAALEEKLKNVQLQAMKRKISPFFEADIKIPKFKAEFTIDLNDVLMKMGMKQMFSPNADFSKMLKSPEELYVGAAIHKAIIEVSEEGTEAAGATAIEMSFLTGPGIFVADHPFYYVIMNEDSVPLFQGTFVG